MIMLDEDTTLKDLWKVTVSMFEVSPSEDMGNHFYEYLDRLCTGSDFDKHILVHDAVLRMRIDLVRSSESIFEGNGFDYMKYMINGLDIMYSTDGKRFKHTSSIAELREILHEAKTDSLKVIGKDIVAYSGSVKYFLEYMI